MILEPPSGSRISVATDGAHPLIVIPHENVGLVRYFVGLFLLAWLAGWYGVFRGTVLQLSSGQADADLVLWLAIWTLGGVYVVCLVYRAFRPSVPESLRLMPDSVTYDSGIPPLRTGVGEDSWRSAFPKRTRTELDWRKLQSLHLRESNDRNRLTVNADGLHLDIALSAGKTERKWLYQLLASRYSLPSGRE